MRTRSGSKPASQMDGKIEEFFQLKLLKNEQPKEVGRAPNGNQIGFISGVGEVSLSREKN